MKIWPGQPYPLGATWDGFGTNFSLFSEVATRVELCLFDDSGNETRIPLEDSTHHVWHGYLPQVLRRPVTCALSARLALSASLAEQARALVARGLPVLFVWCDSDRVVAPGELADVVTALPAEVVEGHHGWLITDPEDFATLLRNALVVHAMLERKRRGQSVVRPRGSSLADLIPTERRTSTRLPGSATQAAT